MYIVLAKKVSTLIHIGPQKFNYVFSTTFQKVVNDYSFAITSLIPSKLFASPITSKLIAAYSSVERQVNLFSLTVVANLLVEERARFRPWYSVF